MSAVVVKLNMLDINKVDAFDSWLTKTHRANCANLAAFEAADKDPDTFVAGHYVRNLSDAAKMIVGSREFRQTLKLECSSIKDSDGTSPCPIFTAAHYATNQKFGNVAGRMTTNQNNHKDYSARGVYRNPEIRDYFQQVVREYCDRAERMAKG